VLCDRFGGLCAHLLWPFVTLLLGSVSLGHIPAFLHMDSSAVDYVILNIMPMVRGVTVRLINRPTLFINTVIRITVIRISVILANKRCVAVLNLLLVRHLLEFNEALLDEVLVALFDLRWLIVSGVCGVTLFAVAVVACHNMIVLGLLDHDHLVNAPLAGSSNGALVQLMVQSMMMLMMVFLIVMGIMFMVLRLIFLQVEWKSSSQALALPLVCVC